MLARAPVRIDLTGGYTDVLPYCNYTVGRSVNAAINLYTSVEGKLRRDRAIYITSEDLGLNVSAASPDELQFDGSLDIVKAAIRELGCSSGIEVRIRSQAPPGTGLGTSGSLGVATVGLIDSLLGGNRGKQEIAELAAQLERQVGIAGGKQDQYAAAFGGFQFLEFVGSKSTRSRLDVTPKLVRDLEQTLLLVHPGGSHFSGHFVTDIMSSLERGNDEVKRHLDALNELALLIRQMLLIDNLTELPSLLRQVRLHQCSLHSDITSVDLEEMLHNIIRLGVTAWKAPGAGGIHACLLLMTKPGSRARVAKHLQKSGWRQLPFRFDMTGLQVLADQGNP